MIGWSPSLNLRQLFATASAVMAGIVNMAMNRSDSSVALKAGDQAPDFSLLGSDERVYSLHDFIGRRAVVLAWFPKAFTGG
jgi:thioredoxin-dependent peroxiredoxin